MTWIAATDGGLAVAVQDRGRFGLRRFGVPLSGALDPLLLAAANLLLGNDDDAAGLEIILGGPTLIARDQPVGVALAGELSATISRADGGTTALPAWQGVLLAPGESLRVSPPRRGIGYLAVSGGVLAEKLLGSRSTYRRAGLGRFLAAGDRLPCGPAGKLQSSQPWQNIMGAIRILPGPQQEHFPKASLDALVAAPYSVTPDSDRMGLRLRGEHLAHNEKGADILTDGVLPGVIQVPADGQPILLLADAQTSGGYAKIATVIAADMPRLGHCRAGDSLEFTWVDRKQARDALAERQRQFTLWRQQIGRQPGVIDEAALYGQNLISGTTAGEDE